MIDSMPFEPTYSAWVQRWHYHRQGGVSQPSRDNRLIFLHIYVCSLVLRFSKNSYREPGYEANMYLSLEMIHDDL